MLQAPREIAACKAQPGEPPAPAEGNMKLIVKNCPTSLCGRKKLAGGGGRGRGVARCLTRHPEEMLFPSEAVPRADIKSESFQLIKNLMCKPQVILCNLSSFPGHLEEKQFQRCSCWSCFRCRRARWRQRCRRVWLQLLWAPLSCPAVLYPAGRGECGTE